MLLKRKKYRRQLNDIGKRKYDFDIKEERKYYSYLSCSYMKNKEKKGLDNKYRFDSYKKWKQYVIDKYKEYDEDELIEFSRYLNQRIRNTELNHTNWMFFVPVLLTIIISKMFEMILKMNWEEISKLPIWICIIDFVLYLIFIFLFVILPSFYMIKQTITPVYDCKIEGYLFIDYKEIIDEMIDNMRKDKNEEYIKVNIT